MSLVFSQNYHAACRQRPQTSGIHLSASRQQQELTLYDPRRQLEKSLAPKALLGFAIHNIYCCVLALPQRSITIRFFSLNKTASCRFVPVISLHSYYCCCRFRVACAVHQSQAETVPPRPEPIAITSSVGPSHLWQRHPHQSELRDLLLLV